MYPLSQRFPNFFNELVIEDVMRKSNYSHTSAQIGVWKCNFSPFQEITIDRSTNQRTDMRADMEVTLPKTCFQLQHAGLEKTFMCDKCSYAAKTNGCLRRHMRFMVSYISCPIGSNKGRCRGFSYHPGKFLAARLFFAFYLGL